MYPGSLQIVSVQASIFPIVEARPLNDMWHAEHEKEMNELSLDDFDWVSLFVTEQLAEADTEQSNPELIKTEF